MRVSRIMAVGIMLLALASQGCGRKSGLYMDVPPVRNSQAVTPRINQTVDTPAQSQPVSSPTMQNKTEPTN